MRITIVGNFGLHHKGTMAARALPIARELARRGHQVTMILPADPVHSTPGGARRPGTSMDLAAKREQPRDERLSSPGARGTPGESDPSDLVRLVLVGRPARSLVAQLGIGLQIAWRAWRARPEVLYAFKPIRYAGLTLLLFWILRQLRLTRASLVLDTDDWEGEEGWADHDRYPLVERQLAIWQERWSLAHADLVTVASRELERLAGRDRGSVLYAPNAASPASPGWMLGDRERGRARLGLGDQPVVLAYTRFLEFDPIRLVTTFEQIRQRVPTAHLIVVGQGLAGEEQVFLKAAHERNLRSAISFAGWVEPSELPDYLAAADVAVYPLDDTRLNRAKCLMKLVDLLLAGVPVVADAVGQATEYIDDGHTGVLVRAGDANAMAEEVVALLRAPERRRRLGRQARQAILTHWRWDEQGPLIARALERLHRAN